MILGFRLEVDESCVLLDYYAASSGNFLPTFRDNISVPSSDAGEVHTFATSVFVGKTKGKRPL